MKYYKGDFKNVSGLDFCPDCEALSSGLDYRLLEEGVMAGGPKPGWVGCGCAFSRPGNCPDCGRPMAYGSCRWTDCRGA